MENERWPQPPQQESLFHWMSNTPDDLVARFRAGLEAIKKNGTFDALKRKWL